MSRQSECDPSRSGLDGLEAQVVGRIRAYEAFGPGLIGGELLHGGAIGGLAVLLADQQPIGTVPLGPFYSVATARLAAHHMAAQHGIGARFPDGGEFTADLIASHVVRGNLPCSPTS